MTRTRETMKRIGYLLATLGVVGLFGCTGIPVRSETAARHDVRTVSKALQSENVHPDLPRLVKDSTLGDYLRFAMLNQPTVRAAYFDWAASVEDITVARSLPDPQLTFQMDISDVVTSIMPGLMAQFPGPGKLDAAANVASATSRAKYFAFESAVLRTAFTLKQAYYQLWFLDQKIQIDRQTLDLLAQLESVARSQNAAGKVTLQDVYRAQIEQDRLTTEIENLEDSRRPLIAQLKGALGLNIDDPDPPQPSHFESTPLDLHGEQILKTAFERNPRLKEMEADVRMAEASLAVANKATIPDFYLGAMADVKMSPVMFRPLAGMTIPMWRDKISAQIASAQAGKRAAQARLSSEQIMVTVDFAMKNYDYREVTRELALLQDKLVPKSRMSLDIARGAYLAGQIDFFNLIDAQKTWLGFQLELVEAATRREVVLADLSLMIAGIAPEGAPILQPPVSPTTRKTDAERN